MQRARDVAVIVVAVGVVGVIGSVLLPLVPAWPFLLFEHFRFQYVWVGVLVVAACAVLRMRGWFDAALLATLVNTLWIVPDLSRSALPPPAAGTPLRVLVLNVLSSSSGFADVRALIADTKPDVIGLVEVDTRWLAELGPALSAYPHRVEQPHDNDNFGVALYSTLPMTGAIESLGSPLATVVARVDARGTPIALVLTHPPPPAIREYVPIHVAQLAAVAQRTRTLGAPVIVMGDLNATPWSRPFRDLVAATGLCDTRAGFGLQASYPAESAIMRIPIDHVLVSCAVGVRSRVIERDVGSDHLPVLVDLVLPHG